MNGFLCRLAGVALLCAMLPAHAALVQIFMMDNSNDRSAWEAAVGGNFSLESFDDGTFEPGVALSGGSVGSGVYADTVGLETEPPVTTTIEFAPDVLAAGGVFDLDPLTVGTGLDIHFEFAGGGSEIVEVRSDVIDPDGEGFTGFVGAISDMPIDRIVIFEGDQVNLGGAEAYTLDDLVFAETIVPIPAALPLFVSAIVGLGFIGRRRRKAA